MDIGDRQLVWDECMKLPEFEQCIGFLKSEYTRLYTSTKGADKYMQFYKAWFGLPRNSTYLKDMLLKMKLNINKNIGSDMSTDTWDTIISTMMYFIFNFVQKKMSDSIESTVGISPENEDTAIPDADDVSLFRLCGWALFSCLNVQREKAFSKSTAGKKLEACKTDIEILEYAVTEDKSQLPTAIKALDRGGMTFPHDSLLPFTYNVVRACRSYLSPSTYKKHGKNLIKVIYSYN